MNITWFSACLALASALWPIPLIGLTVPFGGEFRQQTIPLSEAQPVFRCHCRETMLDDACGRDYTVPYSLSPVSVKWGPKEVSVARNSLEHRDSEGHPPWSVVLKSADSYPLAPHRAVISKENGLLLLTVGSKFYALDLTTGKTAWEKTHVGEGARKQNGIWSNPVNEEGFFFAALNPEPGSKASPSMHCFDDQGRAHKAWGSFNDETLFGGCTLDHVIYVPRKNYFSPSLFGSLSCPNKPPSLLGMSSQGGPMWQTFLVESGRANASEYRIRAVAFDGTYLRALIEGPEEIPYVRMQYITKSGDAPRGN